LRSCINKKDGKGGFASRFYSLKASREQASEQVRTIRPLGGYERLLSRLTPGDASVSLSHTCVALLDSAVTHDDLLIAVADCMQRHPMLTAYITIKATDEQQKEQQFWSQSNLPCDQLAKKVVHSIEASSSSEFTMLWQLILNLLQTNLIILLT
jgi:hypothetical protein